MLICSRTADSSLALGPLMHEFKWREDEFDKLAQGSLAGDDAFRILIDA